MSIDYKKAGVDVEAGYKAVELMSKSVKSTFTKGVLTDIGGFGGLFELPTGYKNPVLVSGTDGVGTKLKIAFLLDRHNTIGQDCVAMCVNDIICSGAKPLFFLDYIALGKNIPEKVADIVSGIADGCKMAGCALVGGETAEMPGFYPEDEYDVAGFSVGIVDKDKIIDGSTVRAGDTIIGIASSGVHSNGFSLIRKLFNINSQNGYEHLTKYVDSLGATVGDTLITPTKIYVKLVQELTQKFEIKAISHITGGGFYENLPRMLPNDTYAHINRDSFEILPIFKLIQELGEISEQSMFNTFNMGIGMAMVVSPNIANDLIKVANEMGEKAYIIGTVQNGEKGVVIC